MAEKWEFVRLTKASTAKAEEYFAHPENYAKNHPDFVKNISIKSKEANTVTYEQEIGMMGRSMKQLQKMTISSDGSNVQIDTVGGSGNGSRVTITVSENPGGGSQLKYVAEMKLGPFGFMAKGAAKSEMEKVANEDAKNLDTMT